MAYVKVLFQNSPSTATPINAENLNHMDDQIAENDRRLNELSTAGVVNTFNSRTGNVTSEKGDYDINQIVASDGQDGYIPVWRNSGTEQEPDWGFEMEEMGGSGHEILDADGTSMAQEDALQFADAFLTDDSVNGRTVVENIKEVDPEDYDSTTDEGIIVTDDGDDALIGPVSDDYVEVEADGVKTFSTLFNELYALVDWTKINNYSYIQYGDRYFKYQRIYNLKRTFACMAGNTSHNEEIYISLASSDSEYTDYDKGSYTDLGINSPTNGEKLTLYYGNKKATVDLQTTANRCLYDSNTTVKQKIDEMNTTIKAYVPFTHSSMSSSYKAIFTKCGNLVVFNFVINATADIPNSSYLISEGGIPSEYRPASAMSMNVGDGIVAIAWPNGSFSTQNISATITTGFHVFSGSYFTNIVA